MQKRGRIVLSSLQIGVVAAGIVLLLWGSNVFQHTQLRLTNILYSPRETTGNVVIVAMDDASLAAYGRTPAEWSREHHAKLVEIVSQGNARAIVFDILFLESTEEDEQFSEAIEQARQSYAATRTVMPIVGLQPVQNPVGPPKFEEVRFPTNSLKDAVESLGTSFNIPDKDGTTRRLPMRVMDETQVYYSLDLMAYLAYLRIPPGAIAQVIRFGEDYLELPSGRRLWLDERQQIMMNFFSEPGQSGFEVYSYRDVLEGSVDPSVFNDKLVLVGLMNSEGQTDLHHVPLGLEGTRMAGVEIHANAIETILQAVPLRPQGTLSQLFMIIGLALFSSIFYGQLPKKRFNWWLVAAVVILTFVWVVAATVIFSEQLIVINLFHSMLAIALPAPTLLANRLVDEVRQRRQVEMLLDNMLRVSSQQMDMERILAEISTDVSTILGCEHVEIWLWDKRSRKATCAHVSCAKEPMASSEALVRQALDSRDSCHQDKSLVVPMLWQGQPLGVLVGHPVARLQRRTRSTLDLFTRQTAAVLANVDLLEESRQLSELKTFIIRMTSHDLKNPLTAIINFSYFLLEDDKKTPFMSAEQREFVDDIQRAANQMRAIINNILDLERVRGGVKKSQIYDMTNLLKEMDMEFQRKAELRQQKLTTILPDHPIRMVMDVDQIRLAFSNLINNAMKYTREGGTITVQCTMNQNKVRIDFSDTGYGIPKDAMDNLFKEFFRVRTPETRNIEGTGLGLSLVKAVIEAHGGRIWVKSLLGSGSTFSVELPFHQTTKE